MYIFKNLNDDKKTAFFLALAMKTVSLLNEVQKNIAENALDYCWKWLDCKVPDGDFLYGLLVDEQDGITIFAESTGNISEQAVWNCITDAVAFTSRKAYEYENSEYYPEPIELVDDEIILHFMECYNCCFPDDTYVSKVAGYLELSGTNSEWQKYIEKIV